MFVTRKELEEENRKLREQLAAEQEKTRRSAVIDKAALPQCKSLACAGCKYVVGRYTIRNGYYILGCGKDNPCKEYEPSELTAEKVMRTNSVASTLPPAPSAVPPSSNIVTILSILR